MAKGLENLLPEDLAPRVQLLHRLAGDLGFALLGVAPARQTQRPEFFRDWLAQGKHGAMDYMAREVDKRLDPGRLVPGARSVICVADSHSRQADGEDRPQGQEEQATGQIARFAWGDDYHRLMKKRLHHLADQLRAAFPDDEFRTAVDTAPILEREQAARAGLGWIGKNTLMLHPRWGSYLLLGEIVTTLALQSAEQTPAGLVTDHCGQCTRCLDACPTQCLTPYQIDGSRCISYLTIEQRGVIEPDLHEAMGDHLAGCDVCQEVCPFNHPGQAAGTTAELPLSQRGYAPRPPAPAIALLEVLHWDAAARQQALINSPLKRIKLDMFKRNALIAAGNWLQAGKSDAALRLRIEELANAEDEPDLVRETARQVLERLGETN